MTDENKVHEDVILVTDKGLAAALFALSHRAMATFQDDQRNQFYCIYKITKRLRDDIRHYYDPGLSVDAKSLTEELRDIEDYLFDARCSVAQAESILTR